jgi:hypothetical protein
VEFQGAVGNGRIIRRFPGECLPGLSGQDLSDIEVEGRKSEFDPFRDNMEHRLDARMGGGKDRG